MVAMFAMLMIVIHPAFAQYDVPNKETLYQEMEASKNKVDVANDPDAFGSGTPYFAADGVLGASALAAGVFGGIATMFFVGGRNGKYAAIGRG